MMHVFIINRPYLFEKLLLGFILQQNVSISRQKKTTKKKQLAMQASIILLFLDIDYTCWLQAI